MIAGDLRPDAPLKLFAFTGDMEGLHEWIRGRFSDMEEAADESPAQEGLGAAGMVALERLLARPVQLHDRLRPYVRDDLETIETLTQEQFGIIQSLAGFKRLAIPGAAGTGKTVLAMEKTMRLIEEGKRTLLLCFNAPLGSHLKRVFEDEPLVWAGSFHGFWNYTEKNYARAFGTEPRDFTALNEELQAEALVDALGESGGEEFDALIIDEGQDFHGSWLEALELAVKDKGNGTYYVFHDDNQKVIPRSGEHLKRFENSGFRLHKNLRNTQKIFNVIDQFYRNDDGLTAIGPEGEPVQWTPCTSIDDAGKHLARIIGDLTKNHMIPAHDISVLLPNKSIVEEVVRRGRLAGLATYPAEEKDKNNGLVVDSIRRFKGLESPAVVVVLTSVDSGEQELLYTAFSRAMVYLHVIGPEAFLDSLQGKAGRRK